MKKITTINLVFGALLYTISAGAQCLPLADMGAIAAEPTALTSPQKLSQLPAGEWLFKGTPPRSKEIQWISAATSADASGTMSPAIFLLRPFLQSFDVVLKTTEAGCVRDLRSQLKSQKLTPIAVTCLGCEAARFDGPSYQTTIYSKMKGDYPFVIVVHPLAAPPVVQPKPTTSSNTTP